MTDKTAIEWADSTFNYWEGCTKISEACDFCYAAERAARYKTVEWGGPRRIMSEATRKQPFKWERQAAKFFEKHGRRRRVFCSSLSDIFDNQVPNEWREDLWETIRKCPSMDWLLLTKRPQNIDKMKPPFWDEIKGYIWLGTTVENQDAANRNIHHLLNQDCAVRFLSCEPLLGPIDFDDIRPSGGPLHADPFPLTGRMIYASARGFEDSINADAGKCEKIDWVITGGESGPNARPSHPGWIRDIRDQCERADTAFLFKQWGEWFPEDYLPEAVAASTYKADLKAGRTYRFTGTPMRKVGKKKAGRMLDGEFFDGFPENG